MSQIMNPNIKITNPSLVSVQWQGLLPRFCHLVHDLLWLSEASVLHTSRHLYRSLLLPYCWTWHSLVVGGGSSSILYTCSAHLTLLHLQIAYALVWLYLHSRHWKYPVYLHSQEEKHRNANTIIEIVVTRKVYILHLTNFTRCTSRLYTTHKCWSMCMKLMF